MNKDMNLLQIINMKKTNDECEQFTRCAFTTAKTYSKICSYSCHCDVKNCDVMLFDKEALYTQQSRLICDVTAEPLQ